MRGLVARTLSLWRTLVRRSAFESEVDEEFRSHLELRTQDLMRSGLGEEDAARRARLEFGGIEGWKEEARQARGLRGFDELEQDLRLATRLLRRWPGFSTVALLTLGLGIGATTAIFGLADRVLLRPLPYEAPEALVSVWTRFVPESGYDYDFMELSVPEYRDYGRATRALRTVAAYNTARFNLAGGEGHPDRIRAALGTANLFEVLRARPAIGRTFRPGEDATGAPCVVVLGHGLWTERFASSPEAVGSTIRLDGEACEVVGVMPRGFFFPDPEARLWRPLDMHRNRHRAEDRESHWLAAVGRLAGGHTVASVEAELQPLMSRWGREHPHHAGHFLVVRPFREEVVADHRATVGSLFGAVLLMLVIICANLGSLLLARAEGRQREMAVRTVLGAGRGRLVRQSLTESMILAMAGGLFGLAVAAGLMKLLAVWTSGTAVRVGELALDGRTVAFAAVVVILVGGFLGLLPGLQAPVLRLQETLRAGGRGTTAPGRAARVRRLLVVAEIALSLAVVCAAALLARSHERLRRVDLGIERSSALAVDLTLPETSYPDVVRVGRFYDAVRTRVLALHGVREAGLVSELPLRSVPGMDDFRVEGRPDPGPGDPHLNGGYVMTTPGYFEAMGIPVLRGRGFTEGDVTGGPLVAVVDDLAVRNYWLGEDPVGQRIRYYDHDASWITIVGVVGSVRYRSPQEEPRPTVYVPHAQAPRPQYSGRAMTLVVKAGSSPPALTSAVRGIVSRLDPTVPLTNVATVGEVVDRATARPRITTGLIGSFALVSLLLGALGVYGILSHFVRMRTQEIGIRMALGESAASVRRRVLRQGMGLALAGIGVGAAAALLFGRLLGGLLYGISPHDPATVAAATLTLAGVSLVASYLPARRATLVRPATALRPD